MDDPNSIITKILGFMVGFLFVSMIVIQSDIRNLDKKLDKIIATQQATTTTQPKVGS